MSALTLRRWEREFRNEAEADQFAVFREHLQWLELRTNPELLLEGTIEVVRACSAYLTIDGRSCAPFLAMQTYDPVRSPRARYAFTFDLWGKAFARVLVSDNLRGLDLADLHGHPWLEFEVGGYRNFWIARADRVALDADELVRLEHQVTEDLRYDYTDDELDFWFDDTHTPGALVVTLQNREDDEDE